MLNSLPPVLELTTGEGAAAGGGGGLIAPAGGISGIPNPFIEDGGGGGGNVGVGAAGVEVLGKKTSGVEQFLSTEVPKKSTF